MRANNFFISTLKEAPSDAEIISHKLMLRAGLIKRLAGGIYTWMPIGLRVVRKVENIVRSELNRSGCMELLMPSIQPSELWEESGRWKQYGPELLRLKDRHDRAFCIGPTHEEVITDVVRRDVRSYRQLPVHFYQIQTKFRDEIRPRFGVMRGREFVMKDGYSFHADLQDLQREYAKMHEAYNRIFTRLGLRFRSVSADTGSIGGTGSHEFHVLADSGEDAIAYCPTSHYAANVELAEALPPGTAREPAIQAISEKATPGMTRCEDVATNLNLPVTKILKSIAVMKLAEDAETPAQLCLVVLRGDHELNHVKSTKVLGPFRFASNDEILANLGGPAGYIGPVGAQSVPIYADRSAITMSDFVCGANREGFHFINVNWGTPELPDLAPDKIVDLRNVVSGDASPDGKGLLEIVRGIEVGHIFQLRTKYSQAMKATFLDESGKSQPFEMGCYGIGITRIVGAAIEQNHDERGIIFPPTIAPFVLAIVPIGYHKIPMVKEVTDRLYQELTDGGVEVLLDDRDERPGVMFSDMELLGIPHRLTIGERGLKNQVIEYQRRQDDKPTQVSVNQAVAEMRKLLC